MCAQPSTHTHNVRSYRPPTHPKRRDGAKNPPRPKGRGGERCRLKAHYLSPSLANARPLRPPGGTCVYPSCVRSGNLPRNNPENNARESSQRGSSAMCAQPSTHTHNVRSYRPPTHPKRRDGAKNPPRPKGRGGERCRLKAHYLSPSLANARPLRPPGGTCVYPSCVRSVNKLWAVIARPPTPSAWSAQITPLALRVEGESGVAYRRIICPLRSLKLAPSAPKGAHVSIPLVCAA